MQHACSTACFRTLCTRVRMLPIARCCSALNLPTYGAASAYCGWLAMYLRKQRPFRTILLQP